MEKKIEDMSEAELQALANTGAKEPGRLKPAYEPAPWRHHREDAMGKPIPPGPTWVFWSADPNHKTLVETEEEYKDALNRGALDTPDPKAWEQKR